MKNYSQFINESVRDKMTPKPEEEIKKGLERKYVGRCFRNKLAFKNEIVRIVGVKYDTSYREWVLQGINVRNNARYGFSPITRFLDEYREVFPKKDKLGRLRYTSVNESVRDRMTPKSKADTKDLLDDIMRILSYTLYKWPTAKWSRTEAHRYAESHRSFVEQWVADNGYSPDRLEILAGEMINYFGTKVNESVRDRMTPKPREAVRKALYRYLKYNVVSKRNEVLKLGLFDKERVKGRKIYVIFDYENYYTAVDSYFLSLTEDEDGVKIGEHEYMCYPVLGLVNMFDYTLSGWYFTDDHLDGLIEYIMGREFNENV